MQGCLRFGDTRREDAAGSRGLSCSPSTDAGAYSAAWASAALPSAGNEPVMNTFMSRASFIKSVAANANQVSWPSAAEVWAEPGAGPEAGPEAGLSATLCGWGCGPRD